MFCWMEATIILYFEVIYFFGTSYYNGVIAIASVVYKNIFYGLLWDYTIETVMQTTYLC